MARKQAGTLAKATPPLRWTLEGRCGQVRGTHSRSGWTTRSANRCCRAAAPAIGRTMGASIVASVSSLPREYSSNRLPWTPNPTRSEEHTSELQSPCNLVCRLLLEKKKKIKHHITAHLNHNSMHIIIEFCLLS